MFDAFAQAVAAGLFEPGGPADAGVIQEVEQEMGFSLPAELHEFLLRWNGASLGELRLLSVGEIPIWQEARLSHVPPAERACVLVAVMGNDECLAIHRPTGRVVYADPYTHPQAWTEVTIADSWSGFIEQTAATGNPRWWAKQE